MSIRGSYIEIEEQRYHPMDEKALLKNSTIIMDPKTPTMGESSNRQLKNNPGIPIVTDVTLDNRSHVTNMDLELFKKVTSGDVASLEKTLVKDTSILIQVTPMKDTLIHIAASWGHDEIIETILGYRSELLMEVNLLGETALHIAARAGYLATVQLLIDIAKRGNVESGTMSALMSAKNHQMETALHVAVRNSRFWISTKLMNEDLASELLCSLSITGESPLHVAVQKGDISIVKEILKRSKLSYEGPNGRTALHAAVINETAEITRLLLKKELVQKRDVYGRTPLHFAAALGFSKILEILLGYDLSTTCFLDNTGYAAIHMAATFGNLDIIKQFIRLQPYLKHLLDRSGQNLLQIAINSEEVDIVRYILTEELFEDLLYVRDMEGNTILHHAVIVGNPHILNVLVKDKRIRAMSTALNRKGCTALSMATSKCDESMERKPEVLVLATLTHLLPDMTRRGNIYDYVRKREVAGHGWDSSESNSLLVVSTLVVGTTFQTGLTLLTVGKASKYKYFLAWDSLSMVTALASVSLLIPTNLAGPTNVLVFLPRILTLVSLSCLAMAFYVGVTIIFPMRTFGFQTLVLFFFVLLFGFSWAAKSMGTRGVLNAMTAYACFVYFESWLHHRNTKRPLPLGQRIEWMTRKIEQVPTAP